MTRFLGLMVVVTGLTGCASTWDDLTSKRFRENTFHKSPFKASDDPLQVLRTNPDGEERARAMRKLKEPVVAGMSQADQDEVMQILATAATSDPSPWVRLSAIDALGRFQDPRGVEVLIAAYHQAPGRPADAPVRQDKIQQVGASTRVRESTLQDKFGLHGPVGFPGDQEATIRGRSLEMLARKSDPRIVPFLTRVATGEDAPSAEDDPETRTYVRQRAVAALGNVRSKDSVVALAQVLNTEQGKDLTLTHLAHGGLVELTGKKLPADAAQWNQVVQAGQYEVTGEPSAIRRAIQFEAP